jgi:hypothetical protein
MVRMIIDGAVEIGSVQRKVIESADPASARVAVISRRFDAEPEALWRSLSDPNGHSPWVAMMREPIAGVRYRRDNIEGTITTSNPPNSLAATWEMGGDVSWIDITLTALPAGGTRLQVQHTAAVGAEPWSWHQFGWCAVMLSWEVELFALSQWLTGDSDFVEASVGAWLGTEEGRAFLRAICVAWGRTAIEGGADEAFAVSVANNMLEQFADGRSPDPRFKQAKQIHAQATVEKLIDGADPEILLEREVCTDRLLSEASEVIRASHARQGVVLGQGDWSVDMTRYLPFQWIWKRTPISRFEVPEPQRYRVTDREEYRLAKGRFPVLTAEKSSDRVLEVELPVRQYGRVIRDELAGEDIVQMSWSIPGTEVEMVAFNPDAGLANIDRAVDSNAKVVVRSHLGIDPRLHELTSRPDVERAYPIPPSR